jgi:sugar-specific transcriptional regulator TrmB
MNKSALIENFELTETEVNIYLTLLELGEATASEVALRNSLNRTFTYDRIDKLVKKGLVSSLIKDDKKYFKAADPNNLLAILQENQEKIIAGLDEKKLEIKQLIPSLLKLKKPREEIPNVELYSTKRGIKSVLNLILKENKALYIYGSIKKFQDVMEHYYEIWNKLRVKNKIKTRILTSDQVNMLSVEMDYLSDEHKTNTTTFTFGDKIAVILWGSVPVAILTESKDIAKSNIHFFDGLWNREVKIYTGIKGIHQAYWELISGEVKEFRGYGYSKGLADIYTPEFSNEWHKERIKRGVDNKIISFDDVESVNYFKPRVAKVEKFEVRYLPEELQGPVCVTFSDNVVVTFIYTEKEFKVVINKNKETINAYRKHFETLWEKSKIL